MDETVSQDIALLFAETSDMLANYHSTLKLFQYPRRLVVYKPSTHDLFFPDFRLAPDEDEGPQEELVAKILRSTETQIPR